MVSFCGRDGDFTVTAIVSSAARFATAPHDVGAHFLHRLQQLLRRSPRWC